MMEHTELPTYIPLSEAATRYAVTEEVLSQSIEDNIIRAVKINDVIVVVESDVAVVAAQVEVTNDELVSISEASRRLSIPASIISNWVTYNWLPVLASGARRAKLISWRQAQALANLREERGLRGSRLIPRNKDITRISGTSK